MVNAISIRRLLAEFLGTAGIVATVVGTGHMVRVLDSDSTVGLILMAMAVGGTLFGAIALLMPISGAHFNPAVTVIMWFEKKIDLLMAVQYIVVQVLGAISGAVVANLMFMDDLVSSSLGARLNAGTMLGEVVATFGLVLLILLFIRHDQLPLIAPGVALWIIAGHFFTSSTSFANPAVTIGRSFTDTATGIDWQATVAFIPMQLVGALLALLVFKVFYPNKEKEQHV
jgi:glycerol uptake facilitator-like aquaporin